MYIHFRLTLTFVHSYFGTTINVVFRQNENCQNALTSLKYFGQINGKISLSAGFEPAREDPNGFLVHRLNHSATTTSGISFSFLIMNLLFTPF